MAARSLPSLSPFVLCLVKDGKLKVWEVYEAEQLLQDISTTMAYIEYMKTLAGQVKESKHNANRNEIMISTFICPMTQNDISFHVSGLSAELTAASAPVPANGPITANHNRADL